jgi:MFS superfamily sulfate permease-like transporter
LWQITLPLVLGVVVVLALAVLAGLAGEAEASLWADISVIFLLIPTMLVALLFLLLVAGLIYVLLRLLKILPRYGLIAQNFVYKVEHRARSGANLAAEPILRYHSFVAAVRTLINR